MPESLKVIALISGGKDSLFSILHCRANGHEVVALANLYPEPTSDAKEAPHASTPGSFTAKDDRDEAEQSHEQDDIESHMYQTIGHSVIPLYGPALQIPIYREPIRGSAVNRSKSYHLSQPAPATSTPQKSEAQVPLEAQVDRDDQDETESLVPLLRRVQSHHPDANALCTGAILSTYQRTRIESVALRLDLVPLAYLWQYPLLPPYTHASLLHDMRAVGMDARIIKVASGGLDSSMLWENVVDERVIRRLGRSMQRYAGASGVEVGAVLGEGGEFETLAIDGPRSLFVRGIVVDDGKRDVVQAGGGAAFVRVTGATASEDVEMEDGKLTRNTTEAALDRLRIPSLWDDEFLDMLRSFGRGDQGQVACHNLPASLDVVQTIRTSSSSKTRLGIAHHSIPIATVESGSTLYLSNITAAVASTSSSSAGSYASQASAIVATILTRLSARGMAPSHISFVLILLRSMATFAPVNEIYSSIFTLPNPPARVTVAVGDSLPTGVDVAMSIVADRPRANKLERGAENDGFRSALHVQSRSYWAPANIGPYSQAVAVPIWSIRDRLTDESEPQKEPDEEDGPQARSSFDVVHVAGQIPLVPASMTLLESVEFHEHAALSLQHLWRVGRAMGVSWWGGGALAFITAESDQEARTRAILVGRMWRAMHERRPGINGGSDEDDSQEDEDVEMDVGNAALYRPWNSNALSPNTGTAGDADKIRRWPLPHWPSVNDTADSVSVSRGWSCPPCFTVEVTELPRAAQVEWWSFGLASKDDAAKVTLEQGGSNCRAARLSISWKAFVKSEELYDFLESETTQKDAGTTDFRTGFYEIFSPHVLYEDRLIKLQAMVMPCRSIWDCDGQELFAAVRWRTRHHET